MRQNFLDNIRVLCIYILIPFHLLMAFNCWGEANYIFWIPGKLASTFIQLFSPWFMPVLFLIAGISARHSLKKRSVGEFAIERIKKLLIPLLAGLLTICPFMSYVADKFHNGYDGNFFSHYRIFFSRFTDLTGYDGGFTPGHLWFILYLFVISFLSLAVILLQKKIAPDFSMANANIFVIVFLGIPVFLSKFILDFGGKSIGQNLVLFLLGYYVFYESTVIEKLKKHKIWIFPLGVLMTITNLLMFIWIPGSNGRINFIVSIAACWFMQLGVLGVAADFFNCSNRALKYMNANSFLFYEFHFLWLLVFQTVLAKLTGEFIYSSVLTIPFAYGLTLLNIELVKKVPVIKFIFGAKNKK